MHADETQKLIEKEQKLMKNALKKIAKLKKEFKVQQNGTDYTKTAKNK